MPLNFSHIGCLLLGLGPALKSRVCSSMRLSWRKLSFCLQAVCVHFFQPWDRSGAVHAGPVHTAWVSMRLYVCQPCCVKALTS